MTSPSPYSISAELFVKPTGHVFCIRPDRWQADYELIDCATNERIYESSSYAKCVAWIEDPERVWNWESVA